MAGALIRELHRKLPAETLALHKDTLDLYHRVQTQKRSDKNKVYSLHEPGVLCIGKGKEHKKYEFGTNSLLKN
jgi:transposase, IS5 family